MVLSKSKLQRIEKRILKQQKPEEEDSIIIPKDWASFCKMTTIRSGNKMVRFDPYEYQIKLVELMDRYPTIIVVKSRQLGITQTVLARFLHQALLNQAFTSVTFFKSGEDRGSNSERVRQMALSVGVKYAIDNVSHQKFAGKGEIYLKNSGQEGSRGYDSVSGFLFDECAFVRNIESIYSASSASSAMVGDNVTKVILSTPSNKSGWYWEQLSKDNGANDLEETIQSVVNGELPPFYYWISGSTCKVIIWWKAHPIYSQRSDYLEYRHQTDNCSWEKIQREYNLSFINSEESVFSTEIVRLNAIGTTEDKADSNGVYYLGVDPAHQGLDYFVAWILRKKGDEYHSIKWYRSRQKTKDYNISRTQDLIEEFKPKIIGIEKNSGGQAFLEDFIKLNPGRDIRGIHTTQESKLVMIERMILSLERKQFIYPKESPIYDEFLQFVRRGQKMEAAENAHDDCIMASAIALTVALTNQSSKLIIPKCARPIENE